MSVKKQGTVQRWSVIGMRRTMTTTQTGRTGSGARAALVHDVARVVIDN